MTRHILVCGSRHLRDRKRVFPVLDALLEQWGELHILHGDAKGADTIAAYWARKNEHTPKGHVTIKAYPADWLKAGYRARPISNQKMLDEGRPDEVIAFPSNPCDDGTYDMMRRARAAGIPVTEYGE